MALSTQQLDASNLVHTQASDAPDLIQSFPVGSGPQALAFDGANIWVGHSFSGDNNLTKVRASDGEILDNYTIGGTADSMTFDGANIWAALIDAKSVMKVRASDGAILGVFEVGDSPGTILFDGANIWSPFLASTSDQATGK